MTQAGGTSRQHTGTPSPGGEPATRRSLMRRTVMLTDMPIWLMLLLMALGLPRTVLADLDIVPPGSSPLYDVLALTPFAVWLAVACFRESRRPFMDFLVLGAAYGLSLVVIHQSLWDVASSRGHPPPAAAFRFADLFTPALHHLAVRGYTVMVAMAIGVGAGAVAGLVAVAARRWRSHRRRAA